MRRLTALLLATVLSMAATAAPHPHRRRARHVPSRHSSLSLKEVPWQLVVAGGAAASGIVFAYKVADGIQQGAVESARASPADFADALGGIGGTVRVLSSLIVAAGAGYLALRLARRRGRPPSGRHSQDASGTDEDEGPP